MQINTNKIERYATAGLPELERVSLNIAPNRVFSDRMVNVIETAAAEAKADPGYARAAGIVPMPRMPLFVSAGPPTAADWIRGAVVALLAPGWRYEIVEGIDGSGHLLLLGYDPA